jgi:YD repeat-containing protein
MKTVTDWAGRVTTYTYDTAGRLTHTDRPNGTRQRLQYDTAHRLTTAFEERGATTLWQAAYTYDDAHRLTNAAISPMPRPFAPPPAVMTYDVDNRLLTYNGQSVPSDLDGNMLAAPLHGTLLGNVTWDARNRLVAAGNTTYAYDVEPSGEGSRAVDCVAARRVAMAGGNRTPSTSPHHPHEKLLVVDATTGSNGLVQAREFHEAIGLTGVIVTKLDGSGKGGIAAAIGSEVGIPTRYVGHGEKPGDFAEFDRDRFVADLI